MKTITRQRLIAALDLIDDLRERKTGAKMQIVQMLACRGLHAMFDQAFDLEVDRTAESQRILLESLYSDVKIRREFVDETMDSCHHFGKWVEYVFRIQRKHQISGLLLGDDGTWSVCDRLRLIEADLPLLAKQKGSTIDRFVDDSILKSNAYRFWLWDDSARDGDWLPISGPQVYATSELYQWAVPDRVDDLLLVTGLDFESCETNTAWIVASNKKPNY
jgi:hypothetical protein